MSPIEQRVFSTVKAATGEGVAWIVFPWIRDGLISPQGAFAVKSISNPRFIYKGVDDMRFTCKFIATLAPDFTRKVSKTYTWIKKGNHYKGTYT